MTESARIASLGVSVNSAGAVGSLSQPPRVNVPRMAAATLRSRIEARIRLSFVEVEEIAAPWRAISMPCVMRHTKSTRTRFAATRDAKRTRDKRDESSGVRYRATLTGAATRAWNWKPGHALHRRAVVRLAR